MYAVMSRLCWKACAMNAYITQTSHCLQKDGILAASSSLRTPSFPSTPPPFNSCTKFITTTGLTPSLILIFVIPTAAIIVIPTAAINRVHAQGKKKSKKGKGKKGKGDEPAGKTQEQIQLEANQVRSQILEWHTDVAGSVVYAVHCLYDTSTFLLPVSVCYTHPILLYAGDGGL